MEGRRKKSRTGCLWALIIFQGLALCIMVFAIFAISLVGKSFHGQINRIGGRGADEYPSLKETWSYGSGNVKVVSIPIRGMILLGDDGGGFFRSISGTADMALKSIRRATSDDDVKAIILNIDSGGGGITASDVLYNALLDFKEAQDGRRVVAICGDVAASGAYYVAVAADHIILHPTTITGSIGVLMQTLNFRELGEKIGIKDVTIKSGPNKDMLNPLGEITEEQRTMMQELVDEMHARFVSLVADGRNLPEGDVRGLADGRVFTATRAMELGLADEIGYWEDAVLRTAALLDVDTVKVYRYEQEISLSALFKAYRRWDPVSSLLRDTSRTRLLYLWEL